MAWCLTAPSHYLNQHWFRIGEVLWHSPGSKLIEITQVTILYNKFEIYRLRIAAIFLKGHCVNSCQLPKDFTWFSWPIWIISVWWTKIYSWSLKQNCACWWTGIIKCDVVYRFFYDQAFVPCAYLYSWCRRRQFFSFDLKSFHCLHTIWSKKKQTNIDRGSCWRCEFVINC